MMIMFVVTVIAIMLVVDLSCHLKIYLDFYFIFYNIFLFMPPVLLLKRRCNHEEEIKGYVTLPMLRLLFSEVHGCKDV